MVIPFLTPCFYHLLPHPFLGSFQRVESYQSDPTDKLLQLFPKCQSTNMFLFGRPISLSFLQLTLDEASCVQFCWAFQTLSHILKKISFVPFGQNTLYTARSPSQRGLCLYPHPLGGVCYVLTYQNVITGADQDTWVCYYTYQVGVAVLVNSTSVKL